MYIDLLHALLCIYVLLYKKTVSLSFCSLSLSLALSLLSSTYIHVYNTGYLEQESARQMEAKSLPHDETTMLLARHVQLLVALG